MKTTAILLLALTAVLAAAAGPAAGAEEQATMSLAGEWKFGLDPETKGEAGRWFASLLEDRIVLPGTTDENKKGTKIDERRDDRLSRVFDFKGAAWYQRRVSVPVSWKGRRITLFLERTKYTRVWVDQSDYGTQDGLSAPQVYDLTDALAPGEHTLTIMVNNAKVPPVGPAHALDERTQTNWNGIIGRLELRATDPVWLDDIQVYPDVRKRSTRVRIDLGNNTGQAVKADLTIRAESWNTADPARFPARTVAMEAAGRRTPVEIEYSFGSGVPLWDEFHPAMIKMTVSLKTRPKDRPFKDSRTVDFGLREFRVQGTQFAVNGRTTFLRGKNDACIFPLTGYPPMDKAGWLRVLKIAQSYGLNHYRFHTWCPPEAAFQAADELGVFMQPELPNKVSFEKPEHAAYLRLEGERILRAFGNHPSLVMLALGNELGGSREIMAGMVEHFRRTDSRHLYAQGSNNFHWEPSLAAGDDFWVTGKTAPDRPVRGSFYQGDFDKASIEFFPPSTLRDFRSSIAGVPVPVVGHENGQFQVSPNFEEIPKYTGVLRARNLEIFRDRLAAAHMLDQAGDFVRASGALSVICYREDIELALRTPGFGGFQLLDLQDFPGQGTALVGILDAFMDSKGLIAPEAWRRFCSETVPLLRFEKYTWTSDETFSGRIQAAHYGASDFSAPVVSWTATDGAGRKVASGRFVPSIIRQGQIGDIGEIRVPLNEVPAPGKLTVEVSVLGTPYANSYDVWIYPPRADTSVPPGVTIAERLIEPVLKSLRDGGTVLLLPRPDKLPHSVAGAFQTDFWCFPMFRRAAEKNGIAAAPGTLGILCDPGHPSLAGFPTEFHGNWQWWHLVKNSRPVILDETPPSYRPGLQVIDNFERNHKLGLIFETRLGKGRLLICAIDLLRLQDKPEARQMLRSLLQYAGSEAFAPRAELPVELLKKLFPSD
jgi:hypothetical protein